MKYKLLRFSLLGIFAMLWGAVFAQNPEVTFDFSVKSNWPTIPTDGTNKDEGTFKDKDNTYSIKLCATTNYKINSGYLILGKKDSYLEFPAFDFDVEKIEVVGTSGASVSVEQNIYVGENEVSAKTTGAQNVTNAYSIDVNYQAAGNVYRLVVVSGHNTQISKIFIYKKGSGQTDTRTATTLTLGEYPSSAELGGTIDLPTATVKAGETTLNSVTVTWDSSNKDVASITGNKINLLASGETTITASFAGNDNYKESSASFKLTVTKPIIIEDGVFDFDMGSDYGSGLAKSNVQNQESTWTAGNVTLKLVGRNAWNDFGSGDNKKGQVRLYGPNKDDAAGCLTLSVPTGKVITSIVFTGASLGNMGTETGEYADGSWTGSANSVSFTATDRTDIYTITVTYGDATAEQPAGFRDIKANLTSTALLPAGVAQWDDVSTGIAVAADGTLSRIAKDGADIVFNGKWHGTQYGWANFSAVVPVEGCVKITLGASNYGNGAVTVTDAEGNEVAKIDNHINAMWSANSPENVAVGYYRTNAATTLTFSACDYLPYFAVEAIDEADLPEEVTVYNVTFAAGEGIGVAPAALEVNAGDKMTAPKNYTLYKEGATLTGWNDGTTTYAVGAEITPEADMTLTAVFTNNEVSLADRTAAVTLNYVLNGYNDNPKYKYEGNQGIMVTQATIDGKTIDVKVDVDATGGKFAYNGSGWHQVNKGTKVTVPSCKGAAIAVATYNDASSVTFGGEAGAADGNTATYEAAGDAETIVIEQVSNNYWNNLSIILPPITDEPVGEWVYRDFGIDLVNILTEAQRVDQTPQQFGVVVAEDGTQTQVAYGAENANIFLKGKYWNDHGWVNTEATVKVEGPVQIDLGNCYYGNGDIVVKDVTGAVVASGTMEQQHTCWSQDKTSIVSVKYKGEATTLTISYGSYLPYIGVKAITVDPDEPVSQDITGTWSYADTGVMNATMALSGSSEAGEVEAMEKNGLKMIVEANGASFRNNNGTNIQVRSGAVFKIPVKNAGDLVTVKGYPDYSYYSIGNSDEIITNTQSNPVTTYTAKRSDAEAGYVAVTSRNDNNYYYSLSVVQYAPKEKITLDNEPATITFPFDEGTEGQKATFSNDDYFLNSKVVVGSNWFIKDKNTYADATETRLEPINQHNDNLTDDDAVSFLFTPKPGFTFTPTKVSFKANRFGTDNGLIDAYWQNVDETTVELEKGIKPERNNSGVNTVKNYDVTGATPGEGTCGLKLFLYHLQDGKQIGLADIVIEGTLSGTEKEVPILASFKVNGTEYAAEDVFGELYEATLELKNSETMVSAENPLTDVTAASGEVGELTYEGTDTQCKVTIPLTAADTQMDYVLNVIYKPFCTLEYVGVDGSVLGTQTVEKDAAIGEFAYDIAEVPATKEGYKARGWFKTAVLGEKFTTADVITGNAKLYAIQTEIEVSGTHQKYFFDLADKNFYAEDHEAFNPAGDGFYWHDAQHGWAFKNGNTVDLLVGPKATVTVTLCQYGSGTGIVVKKGGETLATLDGIAEGDGGTAVYNYEGEPGTLTLEMQCGGEMYIHAMKIVNTAEVNFESEGNWYFVKAGDAGSLIDVLDVVNGVNASKDAERSFIFLPDGIYDLDATVKTAITGHNISLIGQSMDNTIIVTKPDKSIEGLGKADLLDVSGTNLYMQDLTLQNALDYYNAGSAGRAAVLQDAGNRTIGKNVRMLSYQDTYYSSNNSQQAYWETCDIHGTVDFICGGGDIRFQNTTLSLEPRKTDGTGGRTIVAPTTTTQFGYVFDGCTVVDLANGKGDWNFGRTWQNEPIAVYLNTTLDNNAKNTLVSSRWTQKGMNNKDPKLFGEYGTMDAAGNDITPAANTIASFGGNFETILTADKAAEFAYDKMFTDWTPADYTVQVEAPAASYEDGVVTWTPADDGAIAYALFLNDEFKGITQETSFTLEAAPADVLTIRAANRRGGFGEPYVISTVPADLADLIKQLRDELENVCQMLMNCDGASAELVTPLAQAYVNGEKVLGRFDGHQQVTLEEVQQALDDLKQAEEDFQNGAVTGIANVNADKANADIFTLGGQKVNTLRKGVYIINGKKVVK